MRRRQAAALGCRAVIGENSGEIVQLVAAEVRDPRFRACCSPARSVSTLDVLYRLRSERSWDFVPGILYAHFPFFALTWILPFAAPTPRARGWLTR